MKRNRNPDNGKYTYSCGKELSKLRKERLRLPRSFTGEVASKGYTIIKKLPQGKCAKGVAEAVIAALLSYKEFVRTITTGNGTEFAEHKRIAEKLNTTVYFAHPYCSWEKGLIEYTNKLYRQYIPKGVEFTDQYTSLFRNLFHECFWEKIENKGERATVICLFLKPCGVLQIRNKPIVEMRA